MRNTPGAGSGTWAALVRACRGGMDQTALANRLGVDRGTIRRWENGTALPRRPDVVARFAELFKVDLDAALELAGLRPRTSDAEPVVAPTPALQLDPDVIELQRMLDDPRTPEPIKAQIRATARMLRELAEQVAAQRGGRRAG